MDKLWDHLNIWGTRMNSWIKIEKQRLSSSPSKILRCMLDNNSSIQDQSTLKSNEIRTHQQMQMVVMCIQFTEAVSIWPGSPACKRWIPPQVIGFHIPSDNTIQITLITTQMIPIPGSLSIRSRNRYFSLGICLLRNQFKRIFVLSESIRSWEIFYYILRGRTRRHEHTEVTNAAPREWDGDCGGMLELFKSEFQGRIWYCDSFSFVCYKGKDVTK